MHTGRGVCGLPQRRGASKGVGSGVLQAVKNFQEYDKGLGGVDLLSIFKMRDTKSLLLLVL